MQESASIKGWRSQKNKSLNIQKQEIDKGAANLEARLLDEFNEFFSSNSIDPIGQRYFLLKLRQGANADQYDGKFGVDGIWQNANQLNKNSEQQFYRIGRSKQLGCRR